MSTSTPDQGTALELEKLRGEIGVGLSEIKGSLALLVQRAGQADRRQDQHEANLTAVEHRVDVLEQGAAAAIQVAAQQRTIADRNRWLISACGAVLGTFGGWLIALLQ